MDQFFLPYKKDFEEALEHARLELSQLRTGRATPAMVEGLMVEVYGAKSTLKSIASITCPEPRTIMIQPWDRTILKDIERALGSQSMTVVSSTDGMRVTLPMPTEEHRTAMVKVLKEKGEQERVKVRLLRDKIRDAIQGKTKNKELTEDDKYRLFKELDLEIDTLTETLEHMAKKKQQEIMTI